MKGKHSTRVNVLSYTPPLHVVCVRVSSVNAVSAVISGLSCLYQQFWSRRAAVTVVPISTLVTWREDRGIGLRETEIERQRVS